MGKRINRNYEIHDIPIVKVIVVVAVVVVVVVVVELLILKNNYGCRPCRPAPL